MTLPRITGSEIAGALKYWLIVLVEVVSFRTPADLAFARRSLTSFRIEVISIFGVLVGVGELEGLGVFVGLGVSEKLDEDEGLSRFEGFGESVRLNEGKGLSRFVELGELDGLEEFEGLIVD
jgi:hypothetical protein